MKNYEKYADKIREFDGVSFCSEFVIRHIMKSVNCHKIDCNRCRMLQMLWLLEDYKEPETDWSKVAVDTPILVRQGGDGDWLRRHFAKYEDGIVYTWTDAQTSWTAYDNSDVTGWKYAKLAESEEE